jgi:hypothetical protein
LEIRIWNFPPLAVWGCLASTFCAFENTQTDYGSHIAKLSAKIISANLYSKVKASIAQAFAPAFASALA